MATLPRPWILPPALTAADRSATLYGPIDHDDDRCAAHCPRRERWPALPRFGTGGTVSLAAGMGEIKQGYYFQTSAPLVARDKIIVGGWVKDNQETKEPSGVIRAFDVISGELVWAWDLGNPHITRDPPEGESYTRATPNMWTTASYDDRLGLIYAPLGNATPDYYGAERPALRTNTTQLLSPSMWRPAANAGISAPSIMTYGIMICPPSRTDRPARWQGRKTGRCFADHQARTDLSFEPGNR